MGSARRAAPGFFPLDEELALTTGSLTPLLVGHAVRLGAQLPLGRAAAEIEAFRRVTVSGSTLRRWTLSAGQASVEAQEREVERLEREAPEPPPGPDRLVVSADGAMVPLVGGEWGEVKTLAIGEAKPQAPQRREGTVRREACSPGSALCQIRLGAPREEEFCGVAIVILPTDVKRCMAL